MTEGERTPTNLGAKRCGAWLTACQDLGWPRSQMGMLCDLWWEYHDDNGALIESTARETGAEHGA